MTNDKVVKSFGVIPGFFHLRGQSPVLVSTENAALKRRSSTVVRAGSGPGKRAASGPSTRSGRQINGVRGSNRRLNKAHGSNPMVFCVTRGRANRLSQSARRDPVTLAHGKKCNERVHGEDALMPTLEGKSAEVLRLALGRFASSRVAQDDK
jgi:hypothetical protein